MKKQTICLNMIVKNESKVILGCLESIWHLIDYYVINDTGSTDNTREVIKEFFDAKGIRGEIIDHEFRTCKCHPEAEHKNANFFHFGNNRTYALDKCRGKGDYIFIMDADDIVEGKLKFPPKLTADQYYLTVRTDQNIYYKPLLVKNDPKLKWKWYAGLHEYIEGKPKVTLRLIGDYAVISRRLGARNEDALKYFKDAKHLEELMATNKDQGLQVRYKYYYAQSWFDAREYQKAIDAYKEVIKDSGDNKDRMFSCHYMIGRAHVLKGSSAEVIEEIFTECAAAHPNRAEPNFQLLVYFNSVHQYQKAYDYGIKSLGIPMPFHTNYYIDKSIYDYRLLDELIFAASKIGKFRQAIKWSQKLLQEKKYPAESEQIILQNLIALQDELEKQAKKAEALAEEAAVGDSGDKPKLCFYVGGSPIFKKEKFGSELAVLYLARSLARDYRVFIAGEDVQFDQVLEGVKFIHTDHLHEYARFDVMIVSRYIGYFLEFESRKIADRTYMWLHDVDIHTYWGGTHVPKRGIPLIKNLEEQVDGFVTLTPWHKDIFIQTYGVDEAKVHIIGNGIPVHNLPNTVTKVPGRFIWVSQYDRGLAELIVNFPKIIQVIPEAHLEVYRNLPGDFTEHIKNKSWIRLKGQATNPEIMAAMASAEYWVYPTNWPETYCISALEAQALGCICITTDLAGLTTTVGDRGVLIKTRPINSEEYWEDLVGRLGEFEKSSELKMKTISDGVSWARQQSWDNRAKEWLQIIGRNELALDEKRVRAVDVKMFDRLAILKRKFGFEPRMIVDIGANVGQWNEGIRRIFGGAQVKSFEANPECRDELVKKGIDCEIVLLGNKEREDVPFYTIKNSSCTTGASIYLETTSYYEGDSKNEYKLPMRKLDGYIGEFGDHVDLLKLDVQGAELDVLEGADDVLTKTDFVLLEVSTMKYNEGAPLFAEIVRFMNDKGFAVFDILENHYINECCMQVDVLFLKKSSEWCEKIAAKNAEVSCWKVGHLYK